MKKKITGFTDPKIAQKLKKQATSLEPKFNEKVGYPETLFGDLRCYVVEVSEEVTAAVDPLLILQKVGRGKGYITQRDRELNPNGNENDILDYWFSSPGVKVEIDIFNLTPKKYPIGTILLVKQDRDGDFWVCPTAQKHYKAKITVEPNHVPAHDNSIHWATLMEFDALTENWIPVLEPDGQHKRVRVWDRNSDCCVLIGEMHDVQQVPSPDDEERWHWVGEAGLTREAIVLQSAQSGSPILAQLVYHPENSDCLGEVVSEQIVVCNKKGAVAQGERIIVHWVENVWITRNSEEGNITTAVFKLLTDRTREIVNGLTVGKAQAVITDKLGTKGEDIGETVEIVFADKRWLGAVKDCEGLADYITDDQRGNFWIVKECQELTAGFWARTLEDRIEGAPDQDVLVAVVQQTGHANNDFPRELWDQPQQGPPQHCSGEATWVRNPNPTGGRDIWIMSVSCGPGCTSQQNPNDLYFAPEQQIFHSPCVPNDQEQGANIKVRYLADTFPRMLAGALCYVVQDNDITNETDNSTIRYYVIQSDQMAQQLDSTLGAKMCGSAAEVSEVSARTFWPFSQVPPDISSIPNPHNHYGMPGDKIVAEWSEHYDRWEVVEVDLHVVEAAIDFAMDTSGDCPKIVWKTQKMAIERCEDPSAQQELAFTKTKVLSAVSASAGSGGRGSGQECTAPSFVFSEAYVLSMEGCGGQAGEQEVAIPSTQIQVVTGINASGCPVWSSRSILVLADCGDAGGGAFDCGPFECPDGRGSGQ